MGVENKSSANDFGTQYQKLGFVYYLFTSKEALEVSYEKTDDIAVKYINGTDAIEVTIDESLSITKTNFKFLKSLRNFLDQHGDNIRKDNVKFVILTNKKNMRYTLFSEKLIEDILKQCKEYIKSLSEKEKDKPLTKRDNEKRIIYNDLISLIPQMKKRDKEELIKSFKLIKKSEEELKNEIVINLKGLKVFDLGELNKYFNNFISLFFEEYYIKGKKYNEFTDILVWTAENLPSNYLMKKRFELKDKKTTSSGLTKEYSHKLENLGLRSVEIQGANLEFQTYKYFNMHSVYSTWYHTKKIEEKLINQYIKKYKKYADTPLDRYLCYKRDEFDFIKEKSNLLDKFICGGKESLGNYEKVEWN